MQEETKTEAEVLVKDLNDDYIYSKEIFCRYIVRNGKRIYPKSTKFFHFWIKEKKEKAKIN